MTKLFMFTLVSMMTLAACSYTEVSGSSEDVSGTSKNREVKFISNLGNFDNQLRVALSDQGNTWELNDRIGIFMVSRSTSSLEQGNVEYKANTAGSTSLFSATATVMYYPNSGNDVNFIAYYPFQSGRNLSNSHFVISLADQATEAKQKATDLIWSGKTNVAGYNKNFTGTVPLNFTHQLAKIDMTITGSSEIGSLSGLIAKVSGMSTTALFNLSSGNISSKANVADITAYPTVNGSRYTAIVLPEASVNAKLKFLLNSQTFELSLPNSSFEAGKRYKYNIAINKTIAGFSGTITAWSEVDRGSFTAQ